MPKKELKEKWTVETRMPTREEAEAANKAIGIAPCKYCGSYLHGSGCHEIDLAGVAGWPEKIFGSEKS